MIDTDFEFADKAEARQPDVRGDRPVPQLELCRRPTPTSTNNGWRRSTSFSRRPAARGRVKGLTDEEILRRDSADRRQRGDGERLGRRLRRVGRDPVEARRVAGPGDPAGRTAGQPAGLRRFAGRVEQRPRAVPPAADAGPVLRRTCSAASSTARAAPATGAARSPAR